jgi:hypothetical protein
MPFTIIRTKLLAKSKIIDTPITLTAFIKNNQQQVFYGNVEKNQASSQEVTQSKYLQVKYALSLSCTFMMQYSTQYKITLIKFNHIYCFKTDCIKN